MPGIDCSVIDEDLARRLAPCPHCTNGLSEDARAKCSACSGHAYLTCLGCGSPATAGLVRLAYSEEPQCERCAVESRAFFAGVKEAA